MAGPLLEQIQSPLLSVMADGAYDAEPVYRAMAEHQPDSPPAVIIPPRATAVLRSTAGAAPSLRDHTFKPSRRRVVAAGRGRSATENVRWWRRRCSATRP